MQLPSSLFSLLFLFLALPLAHSAPRQSALVDQRQQQQQHRFPLFSDSDSLPSAPSSSVSTRPSRYTSTILARRLLALSTVGDLATVFPANSSSSLSFIPPPAVAAAPIALPEYIADCEQSGDPTLIALDVSTSTKNARAGSNVSLTLSWWDQYTSLTHTDPWAKADLPRLALIGSLQEISQDEVESKDIVACFQRLHRDSRLWTPGRKGAAHTGWWARVKVEEVYWVGGFGDRHFIGWLDPTEWRGVERGEWEGVRLPGEKKE